MGEQEEPKSSFEEKQETEDKNIVLTNEQENIDNNNLITNWELKDNTGWNETLGTFSSEKEIISDSNGIQNTAHKITMGSGPSYSYYKIENSEGINIDSNKTYKVSLWIKSSNPAIENSLIINFFKSNKDKINPPRESYKSGVKLANEWEKWEVYLKPKKNFAVLLCNEPTTEGKDWCSSKDTASITLRFKSRKLTSSQGDFVYIMYPKIEEVDSMPA